MKRRTQRVSEGTSAREVRRKGRDQPMNITDEQGCMCAPRTVGNGPFSRAMSPTQSRKWSDAIFMAGSTKINVRRSLGVRSREGIDKNLTRVVAIYGLRGTTLIGQPHTEETQVGNKGNMTHDTYLMDHSSGCHQRCISAVGVDSSEQSILHRPMRQEFGLDSLG